MLLALFSARVSAQSLFDQAPPAVDEALRGRVRLYYQAEIDGKRAEAGKLAASDSREMWAQREARTVKKFEIGQITWEKDFSEARVMTTLDVGQEQGFPFPELTFWKIEKGQWVWWLPPAYRKKAK